MGEEVIGWPEDMQRSEDKVQTGPPALLRSCARDLLLLRFIAARRARGMSGWRATPDDDEHYV